MKLQDHTSNSGFKLISGVQNNQGRDTYICTGVDTKSNRMVLPIHYSIKEYVFQTEIMDLTTEHIMKRLHSYNFQFVVLNILKTSHSK